MGKSLKKRYYITCISFLLGFLFTFSLGILPVTGNSFHPSSEKRGIQLSSSTFEQTYYVSPFGDDKALGTSLKNAWKTTSRVNQQTFRPGDQILFHGGKTFEGGLLFDSNDRGIFEKPILISSYGKGRAMLLIREGNGIFAYNTSGFKISNITFLGSGTEKKQTNGINFFNDLSGNVQLNNITIAHVEVSGFTGSGILIGGWNQKSGYRNVTIQHVATHDNSEDGLSIYAKEPNAHQDIYVSYVEAFNNSGLPRKAKPTGSGIVLGGVNRGKIEYSLAYNNGHLNDSRSGPVGIWTYDSSNIIIQHNESHHNRTGGRVDGGGFDLDHDVSNSVLQYNYSHENEGAGYLLAHGKNTFNHNHNTVRYNVSYHDGLRNDHAGILLYGRVRGAIIHNNTIISNKAIEGKPSAIKIVNYGAKHLKVDRLLICNNHFEAKDSNLVEIAEEQLTFSTSILLIRNNYYTAAHYPEIQWGRNLYTSLEHWRRETGQERFKSQAMERNIQPRFINISDQPLSEIRPGEISNRQYLSADSQLIDQGIDLNKLFNIDPGQYDFYKTLIPQSHQYDIGAYEWKATP